MIRRAVGLALLFALAACEGTVIDGHVSDATGEALPGVVVQALPSGHQDLSDARGVYSLRVGTDDTRLSFSKSGYAPDVFELPRESPVPFAPPETALWRLPLNPGVFLLSENRYEQTDRAAPEQYFLKKGTVELGTVRDASTMTTNSEPMIVCYRTPRYDAKLSRMMKAEATRPTVKKSDSIDVWIVAGTLNVGLEPLDPVQGQLLRVVVDRPLEPGLYAVHWGAIEGYATLDSSIYLFRVLEPPQATLPGMEPETISPAPAKKTAPKVSEDGTLPPVETP